MLRECDRAEMGLHLREVVYYGISYETNVQLEFFKPYQPLIKNVPFQERHLRSHVTRRGR